MTKSKKPLLQRTFKRPGRELSDFWASSRKEFLCPSGIENFISFPKSAEQLHFSIYYYKPHRTALRVTWRSQQLGGYYYPPPFAVDGQEVTFEPHIAQALTQCFKSVPYTVNEKVLWVTVEWS